MPCFMRARTLTLKAVREPFDCRDLCEFGTADPRRHTIDTHWPLLRESPTNTILFPLSLSSRALASNLPQHEISRHSNAHKRER